MLWHDTNEREMRKLGIKPKTQSIEAWWLTTRVNYFLKRSEEEEKKQHTFFPYQTCSFANVLKRLNASANTFITFYEYNLKIELIGYAFLYIVKMIQIHEFMPHQMIGCMHTIYIMKSCLQKLKTKIAITWLISSHFFEMTLDKYARTDIIILKSTRKKILREMLIPYTTNLFKSIKWLT